MYVSEQTNYKNHSGYNMNTVKIIHDTKASKADWVSAKVFINDMEVKGVKAINTNLETEFMNYEVEMEIIEPFEGNHADGVFATLCGPNADFECADRDTMKLSILSFEAHVEIVRDIEKRTWGDLFKK